MADPIDAAGATVDAAGAAAASHGLAPLELFLRADSVVKLVIILLVLASAWSWAIIFSKLVRLYILNKRAGKLIDSVQAGLPISSVAESFASVSAADPFVTVYKAMVEEHHRSADLVSSEIAAR